ncbi:MAG: hypothetical protein NVSMB55_07320 [Mycobacteriales bacterium]
MEGELSRREADLESPQARVLAGILGALLPFLPLLVGAGWITLRLRRRAATP